MRGLGGLLLCACPCPLLLKLLLYPVPPCLFFASSGLQLTPRSDSPIVALHTELRAALADASGLRQQLRSAEQEVSGLTRDNTLAKGRELVSDDALFSRLAVSFRTREQALARLLLDMR